MTGNTRMVEWTVEDGIGILTLNAPPHNYLEDPELVPLETFRNWIEGDPKGAPVADGCAGDDGSPKDGHGTDECVPKVDGLVIRGKGRHFCAGADKDVLLENAADPEGLAEMMRRGRRFLDYVESLPVPVVAAVRGACFGGGLELALAAHFRVCAENTMFSFPETGLGLMPGLGGTVRMPLHAGKGRSLSMILCGTTVGARKAVELGIVDRLVPKGEEFTVSIELIRGLIRGLPRKVVRSVVRAVNNSFSLSQEEAFAEETRMFVSLARDEYLRRRTEEPEENRST